MKIAFFEIKNEEKAYITSHLPKEHTALFFAEPFKPELLKDHTDIDALSVFVQSHVNASNIATLSNLKLITTRSTGFDHLDTSGLSQKGIALGYVPGYGDNTVAEFAFGLLLAVARKIVKANARIRLDGDFEIHDDYEGFDLFGKTIGIVGTGRIGTHMIRIANGFGMKVLAYDPMPKPELSHEMNFTYTSLDNVLAQSDVISLHVPYCDQTHHLITKESFAKMKQGAILINTARGAIIDTKAMLEALQTKKLGGAGIDVLEGEEYITDEYSFILYGKQTEQDVKTFAQNHILVDMPNVIITPHIAFYTKEALYRILDTDMKNIAVFAQTGKPSCDIMTSRRITNNSQPTALTYNSQSTTHNT